MQKIKDMEYISGHFRTTFKISVISEQRPGLRMPASAVLRQSAITHLPDICRIHAIINFQCLLSNKRTKTTSFLYSLFTPQS